MANIQIFQHNTLDSTNDEAKRLFKKGVKAPFAVTAEAQSMGKGSQGRKWNSQPGGLYYSILVNSPQFDFSNIWQYHQKIGGIIIRLIQNCFSVNPILEWPNDIILSQKKLGGILIESVTSSTSKIPKYVIIGIGLNVNQKSFPDPLKSVAISLCQETGKEWETTPFISKITEELHHVFTRSPRSNSSKSK